MNTTKLMDRLFSEQEPDFSQKVQEGIEAARKDGKASMPDEHLEFSADAEGKVEIMDSANNELTIATPNPEDPTDEQLVVGEIKTESDEEKAKREAEEAAAKAAEEEAAKKAAEEAEKAAKKAETEQQIATNLEEIKKEVSDMAESKDKTLAESVKSKVQKMSEDLEKIDAEAGIEKDKIQDELKSFSDQADAIIAEADEAAKKAAEDALAKEPIAVEAEIGEKKFSIAFPKGISAAYVASFMKAFSEKVEEIKSEEEAAKKEAEEAEKKMAEQAKPEVVIANNLDELGKAVESLKESGDKDLAAKVEEKVAEVKKDIEEAKKDGIDVEKAESQLKQFSDDLEAEKAKIAAADEEAAKKAAEEEAARKEAEEAEKAKSFSQIDQYLGMGPKEPVKKDKTFSAKEVEEAQNTLGGCLFHKF